MALIRGHILSESYDLESKKLTIELFGRSETGPFKIIIDDQKAVFFVDSESPLLNQVEDKKVLELKSQDMRKVSAVYASSLHEFESLKQKAGAQGVRTFEQDVSTIERFLMERFIFREIEFEAEENSQQIYINPKIRRAKNLDINFTYVSLDIETGVDGSLYSIALDFGDIRQTNREGIVFIIGDEESTDQVKFFSDERSLLMGFVEKFNAIDPDFLFGWHVIGFDLKFIFEKALKLGIQLNIGRDRTPLVVENKNNNFYLTLKGRVAIDGPVMMRSNFFSFEDFKLETVAQEVLGTGKDIASDESKVDEIERRFREDKMGLAKYNLLDSQLVTDIYFKTGLLDLLLERSKLCGLSIEKVHFSSASFDFIYLPLFHRKGFVAPNISDINREFESSGGLVLDTEAGLHEDVIIIDFKSLYPTLMVTFNIDPYSYLMGKDGEEIPSGHKFSMEEAPLSQKMKEFLDVRKRAKSEGKKELSQAVKILMNSFYGILGSSRSRFYQADLPMAITQTGQWILKTTKEFIEKEGLQVLYGDTDSLFVKLRPQDKFSVNEVGTKLVNKINQYLEDLISKKYKRTSFLEVEFEKHFSKMFFPMSRDGVNGAKKRYVGVRDGELEFIGMEFVRSDWSKLAREFQYRLFEALFQGDSIEMIVKDTCKKLEEGFYDNDLVMTKRLSKDPKEYTKNIPPHVRAALLIEHKGPYRLKQVSYLMTNNGPMPISLLADKKIDYNYYKEKQLKPIADNLLQFEGRSWDAIMVGDQLSLF